MAAVGATFPTSLMKPRTREPSPGTGKTVDWPMTYEEREPYYTKGEWELGISGRRIDTPLMAPMVQTLSIAAVTAESFRRAAQNCGGQAWPHCGPKCHCDSQPALSGAARVHQLRDVLVTVARSKARSSSAVNSGFPLLEQNRQV